MRLKVGVIEKEGGEAARLTGPCSETDKVRQDKYQLCESAILSSCWVASVQCGEATRLMGQLSW